MKNNQFFEMPDDENLIDLISPEEKKEAANQWLDVDEYLKGMKNVGNKMFKENLAKELEKDKNSPELDEADKQMEFFENLEKEGK